MSHTPLAIDLAGRTAVVTGAGKGIGRAICLELARAGADTFGVSRTGADLDALGEEVRVLGVRFGSCVADLTSAAAAEGVARRTRLFGHVVAFLASDLAGMINGEIVAIDGGYAAP